MAEDSKSAQTAPAASAPALPLVSSPALQKKFIDLELWRFASGGGSPEGDLTSILLEDIKQAAKEKELIEQAVKEKKSPPERTAGLLEFTFKDEDGKPTNLLVYLIEHEKYGLVTMLAEDKDKKFNLPAAMINGYRPDPKSPQMLSPLVSAMQHGETGAAAILLDKMDKATLTGKITPDGGTLLHIIGGCSERVAQQMLEALEQKLTKDERNTLFAQKNTAGKTPPEIYPPGMKPFFDKKYITEAEVKKLADGWLGIQENEALKLLTGKQQEHDNLTNHILAMYTALDGMGMKQHRHIDPRLGQDLINVAKADKPQQYHYYCFKKLEEFCRYADDDTKNKWLEQASEVRLAWVPALNMLLDNGAKVGNLETLTNIVYSEDRELVNKALNNCKDKAACLDSKNPALAETARANLHTPGNSALRFAIQCNVRPFNESARLPIVGDLIREGAEKNEQTYFKPMTQKIVNADSCIQLKTIQQCMELKLPYPDPDGVILNKLKEQWDKEDKALPPGANKQPLLNDRGMIKSLLKEWKERDKIALPLPITLNAGYQEGEIIDASPLPAALMNRRMVRA